MQFTQVAYGGCWKCPQDWQRCSASTPCLAASQKGLVHSFGTGIGLVTLLQSLIVTSLPLSLGASRSRRGISNALLLSGQSLFNASRAPDTVPVSPPALAHSAPEAERRQLTVMFCDDAAYASLLKSTRQQVHQHLYTQARALCQQVGETPQLVPVLFGLWRFYLTRLQLYTAREIGETLLRLAQHAHDPTLTVVAHYALWVTWLWLGALPAARTNLEEGMTRYTPEQRRTPVFRMGQDPGVACRAYAAWTLWLLGYPDQALACIHKALALAHELSHPVSLAFARCFAPFVAQFRRSSPGGEIAGAACGHEPGTPVAAAGQAPGNTRPTGADLRLVYRGL